MTEVKDIDREAATSVAVLVEMRELIRDGRAYYHATPFAVHREAAEKAERDRIVAWLRSNATLTQYHWGVGIIDAIERGEAK